MTVTVMDEITVYEVLVAEHEGMLLAYVSSFVTDPFQAEDICQEAFVLAFQQLPTLQNKAAFPSWLRAIARNLSFAYLRKQRLEVPTDPEIIQGMEDVFQALDVNRDPRLWQERLQTVAHCVGKLPDIFAECCRLHYYDGKTAREISEHLGTSVAAVLKRLERTRTLLAECVSKQMQLEDA